MRQILNIGLDAPKNPEVLRWYTRNYAGHTVQVRRIRQALYMLGIVAADLERHGDTLVVKLRRPLSGVWLYWLCKQSYQDCIAVVTWYMSPPNPHWQGKLVGPAKDDYEPFQPAEFIGLPEDF